MKSGLSLPSLIVGRGARRAGWVINKQKLKPGTHQPCVFRAAGGNHFPFIRVLVAVLTCSFAVVVWPPD